MATLEPPPLSCGHIFHSGRRVAAIWGEVCVCVGGGGGWYHCMYCVGVHVGERMSHFRSPGKCILGGPSPFQV